MHSTPTPAREGHHRAPGPCAPHSLCSSSPLFLKHCHSTYSVPQMAKPRLRNREKPACMGGQMGDGEPDLVSSLAPSPRPGRESVRKFQLPVECALGTGSLILFGVPESSPGLRVPSSFKGSPEPAELPGGEASRQAGWAPQLQAQPHCQTSEVRGGFGLRPRRMEQGSAEPGAAGNRAGISWFCQLHQNAPETTCRTKPPGCCLEGERIREKDRTRRPGARSLLRAWELPRAFPEMQPHRKFSGTSR